MAFGDEIIHNDTIVKIESSTRKIKTTSLFDRGFSFVGKTDLLINLMQDHGDITIDQATTDPIFNQLSYGSDLQSVKSKVAILLGKYAEALMVMTCNQDDSFNRHFARKARFGKKSPNDYLNHFVAIGTGSAKTKEHYRMHYQYSESQRDIVWVDKRDVIQLLTIPRKRGAVAGLQLKVSYDWRNLKSKLTQYYYPILYFPMNGDWDELNDYINWKKQEKLPDYDKVTLVEMDSYTHELLHSLRYFEKVLRNLIEGRYSIKYLIDKAIAERETAVGHALSKFPDAQEECLITAHSIDEAREILRREERRREMAARFGN